MKLVLRKSNTWSEKQRSEEEWPIEWFLVAFLVLLACVAVAVVLWFVYAKDAP